MPPDDNPLPVKPKILAIDDELINIEIIDEIFGRDFEVIFATKGEQGIAVAGKALPDLILLDIVMPDMDGYEVCTRLKADPRTAKIPIIFISALGAVEQEVLGLEAGAIDYVTKPISPAVLRARVHIQLELKRARELLEMLATTDGMTGLANRRYFDQRLSMEYERLKRSQSRLTVIMIDIDSFKAYNDTYGHLAGDDCLKEVAGVIRTLVRRPADLAARYGGEEFVCLLPEIDHPGAVSVAENIRQAVEARAIEHARSTTGSCVTISMGIATAVCIADRTCSALLAVADEALYAAKEQGRNRCIGKEP
ncbi:diguanylate cyclase [soil metagenome]